MEKLCKQALLEMQIDEVKESEESSQLFCSDSENEEFMNEKHRILYRQQSASTNKTGLLRRGKKNALHTIEILMHETNKETYIKVEDPSPRHILGIRLKSSDSLDQIDKKKKNRRKYVNMREKASNLFMRNTMTSLDEPEKLLFIPQDEYIDEQQKLNSILKNHFIFFCYKKMKGRIQ